VEITWDRKRYVLKDFSLKDSIINYSRQRPSDDDERIIASEMFRLDRSLGEFFFLKETLFVSSICVTKKGTRQGPKFHKHSKQGISKYLFWYSKR
jgi:hypothetical protein